MRLVTLVGAVALTLCLAGMPLQAGTKKASHPASKAGASSNRLSGLLKVVPVEKTLDTASKVKGVFKKASRTVSLKCQLLNQGSKPLGALRGTLRFTSYFGDLIGDLSVEVVAPVAPGQSVTTTWKIKRERFASDEAFKTFADTPLDKMRVTWIPSMVVLSDGTRLLP